MRIGLVVALALMSGMGVAQARVVTIQNASFETPPLTDNAFVFGVPGWTVSGADTGVFNPPITAYPTEAPNGQNVAFISTGSAPSDALSQTLAETLQPSTTYILSAAFGVRADGVPPNAGSVALELYAGTALIATATPAVPAPGTFTTATATIAIDASHPNLGQPLQVRLVGNIPNGGQFNFDSVQLQAIGMAPIPAVGPTSLAMMTLLMLAVAFAAHRRRA